MAKKRFAIVLTSSGLRERFRKTYGGCAVMTDNELEEIMLKASSTPDCLKQMKKASDTNAESIESARISYGKY